MAVLTAPIVNYDSGNYPHTTSFVVLITSIDATAHLRLTQNILPAPSGSILSPDLPVGYATSG